MGTTNQTNNRKRPSKAQIERRRRRRRRAIMLRAVSLGVSLLILVGAVWGVTAGIKRSGAKRNAKKAEQEAQIRKEEEALENRKNAIAKADLLAQGYDYDGAIELIESLGDYESDAELVNIVASYIAAKSTLVTVDVTNISHIFFQSLIVDTEQAFDVQTLGQSTVSTLNAGMTTVEEFKSILQELYDNGYVFVRMRDLVIETEDEEGNITYKKNTSLKLPPEKKAIILSIDDLSYYHSYENAGFAEKLVLDEHGDVKCQYTDSQGNTTIGDYDVVPIMEAFLEEHPDAAYKGARGMIALTGYNGVFGYRTDTAYKTGENLTADQQKWLKEHPDFDWDKEVKEAKKIAEALKADGWEFASHTWGHINVSGKDVSALKTDHEKWKDTVGNIVGEIDTIVFGQGADIGNWKDYSSENAQYAYYKSEGINFFCNIDSTQKAWIQIRENYVRQGRISLGGSTLYKALQGQTDVLEDMFNIRDVYDSTRPAMVG